MRARYPAVQEFIDDMEALAAEDLAAGHDLGIRLDVRKRALARVRRHFPMAATYQVEETWRQYLSHRPVAS